MFISALFQLTINPSTKNNYKIVHKELIITENCMYNKINFKPRFFSEVTALAALLNIELSSL